MDSMGKFAVMVCDESALPEPDSAWIVVAEKDMIEPASEPLPILMVCYCEDKPLSEVVADITESRAAIYLYGFIEYDTLGSRWRKEFGYRWMPYNPKASAAKIFTGFSDRVPLNNF